MRAPQDLAGERLEAPGVEPAFRPQAGGDLGGVGELQLAAGERGLRLDAGLGKRALDGAQEKNR